MSKKEATARIKINKMLEEAGWRFFDDENGKANIALETNVKLTKNKLNSLGDDFQTVNNGFVDFLLLDDRGFPIVVLEAKRENKNPLDGKEQARKYAKSLNVRFIILSNGNISYFWDLEKGNPNLITKFPTLDSIYHSDSFKPNPENLIKELVEEDYVVLTQYPTYQKDASWINEQHRERFIDDNDLKFLRKYQVRAIHALQEAVSQGKDRFLFEMATGTGKTLVSAAVIKLFLRTGNVSRVLFLVDRLELEEQARKSFVRYLKNDYTCVVYKENKDDWKKAEIVVSTVQSLIINNKFQKLFSPNDFDLVISDEAHRSISGNSRAVFEYFVGYKLGLTATPKDYLKNITNVNRKDPREWERRQLLDTYSTFGCESGIPTFRYSLIDGVKDGYLINPIIVDARTEITTELLSDEGYSVILNDEEGNEEEKTFFNKDFEKKFFSEETNYAFCKAFIENALKDPISGEIGKTIVFCVSQSHASKVTQILNEIAMKVFPNKYNSDFAIQVTSNISDAQQFTINFTNNNLLGTTNFLEGYKSSKVRVCVTVGMMTTGYDCPDLLNVCLMRPIFSPSDFVQIKGRGTRLNKFYFKDENNDELTAGKAKFKLFDFFANCEYFEEKFNYDEVVKLSKPSRKSSNIGESETGPNLEEYFNTLVDPVKDLRETQVGIEGMKVDRQLFDRFEAKVKDDSYARSQYEAGNYHAVEEYIKTKIFNKPNEYYNLDKLRHSVKLDRRLNLREVIDKIFGKIMSFKTKDELLEEEFQKFISIYKPTDNILEMKTFFKAYVSDEEIRNIIETKQFGKLATNPKLTIEDIKVLNKSKYNSQPWTVVIPEYIKDYVSINKFMS